MKAKLEVLRLKGGLFIRPKGQFGTCGWIPKPWTLTRHYPKQRTAIDSFLANNKHWKESDIGRVSYDRES